MQYEEIEHRQFQNKNTGEIVRFDSGLMISRWPSNHDHYHRYNSNGELLDRYGNIAPRGSKKSHLFPPPDKKWEKSPISTLENFIRTLRAKKIKLVENNIILTGIRNSELCQLMFTNVTDLSNSDILLAKDFYIKIENIKIIDNQIFEMTFSQKFYFPYDHVNHRNILSFNFISYVIEEDIENPYKYQKDDFKLYTGFFHDGVIDEVDEENDVIKIKMRSFELDSEYNFDPQFPLNDLHQIQGTLNVIGSDILINKITDSSLNNQISNSDIINFYIKDDHINITMCKNSTHSQYYFDLVLANYKEFFWENDCE